MVHGVRLARRPGAVVPQPLGALGRRRRRRSGEPVRGDARRVATSPPTPTCSSTPGARSRWSRRGSPPYELTARARHRRAAATSTAPCPAPGRPATPPTRTRTRRPASCTPSPTTGLRGNRVDYTVLDTDGPDPAQRRRSRSHGSPMMHDFALTENYVVLYDLPGDLRHRHGHRATSRGRRGRSCAAVLGRIIGRNPLPEPVIARVARGGSRRPADAALLAGTPTTPPGSALLPRDGDGDDVRWFEIDPCFVFHTLNAYDDGDTVVVDVVRHDRMFATVLNGPDEGPPTLARFTIDLVAGKVREDRLRRALAGVPAPRRAADRPAAPLRLRRRASRAAGTGRHGARHDLVAGTHRRTTRSAPAARPASSASCRRPAARPRTTAC